MVPPSVCTEPSRLASFFIQLCQISSKFYKITPQQHLNMTEYRDQDAFQGKRCNLFLSERDSWCLDEIVRIGVIKRWPNANRSTLVRALINALYSAYDDNCQLDDQTEHFGRLLEKAMITLPSLKLPHAKASTSTMPATAESATPSLPTEGGGA
jgi:hypothetical protein